VNVDINGSAIICTCEITPAKEFHETALGGVQVAVVKIDADGA
jgi:hypothetical protein